MPLDAMPLDAIPLDAMPLDRTSPGVDAGADLVAVADLSPTDASVDALERDAEPMGDATVDALVDQGQPAIPAHLVNTPLTLTGECWGSVAGWSACYPGTPGRVNGCCPHSYSLSRPSASLTATIVEVNGGYELQVEKYVVNGATHTSNAVADEITAGRFVADPFSVKWPSATNAADGKLSARVEDGALSAGFGGTQYFDNTAYCPQQVTTVGCSWQ